MKSLVKTATEYKLDKPASTYKIEWIDKKNKTALTNHSSEKKHQFDFEGTKIIKTESNTRKREFLEMIEIQKSKNTITAKTDTKYLSKIYHNII